jgi:hypothetical protein
VSGLTAIVAHDAGGAEILASHVRRLPPGEQARCLFALEGPALQVFARKLPQARPVPLEDAIGRADRLLCGTGWQSELELRAIALARAQGKPSAAFHDHWVNYRARFVRGERTVLPDEVWVGDALALERARAELPEVPSRLVDNPYFVELREQLAARPVVHSGGDGLSVLFLCEPVREHALRQHGNERHWGYTEEEALAYFLDHVDALPGPVKRIVVRPHPAEAPGKYDAVIARWTLPIALSTQADVLEDILASDWVVGCNTVAMVTALVAGRQALCCIPPGGRPCVLPQREIVQLAELVKGAAA